MTRIPLNQRAYLKSLVLSIMVAAFLTALVDGIVAAQDNRENPKRDGSAVEESEESFEPVLRIAIYDRPRVCHLGLLVAQRNGFFQEEGLYPAEFTWRDEKATVFDLLKEKKVEFAVGWMAEGLRAASSGIPVVAISLVPNKSTEAVCVRRDLNPTFSMAEDLDNRRVGLAFRRDLSARAFLHRIKVNVTPVVTRPESGYAFNEGIVDAVIMPEYAVRVFSQYTRVRDNMRFVRLADEGVDYPEDTVFCLESTLRESPEKCRKVLSAMWHGWERAFQTPEESVKLLIPTIGAMAVDVDPFFLTTVLDAWKPYLHFDENFQHNGHCERERFDSLRKDLIDAALIDGKRAPVFEAFFFDMNPGPKTAVRPAAVAPAEREKPAVSATASRSKETANPKVSGNAPDKAKATKLTVGKKDAGKVKESDGVK